MLFRLDRRRRAGRFLAWKVRIFVVGAGLGVAGIYLDIAWLRLAGIVILASAMLVRFLPGGREEEEADPEDDDGDGAPA